MTNQETTKFNKSSFIRSRPNMKVQEIIDEAAKMGQTISPGAIWTLRSADKRKAGGKKDKKAEPVSEAVTTTTKAKKGASKVAKATKKVTKATKKVTKATKKVTKATKKVGSKGEATFNKSAFIRKYPKLSAKDIIDKAKELGQNITIGMIYTLRSSDRKKEGSPTKGDKKASTRARKAPKTLTPSTGHSSITFDPSDPVARKLIAAGLAATA